MQPILLVEDETDDIALTERAVKMAGIHNPLHSSATLADARRYLVNAAESNALPALIVLDLSLPDGRGDGLLEWLRSQPGPLGAVPVLVVTVSPERRDQLRAERLGAVLYLLKPVDPDLLSQAIRSLGLRVLPAPGGNMVEGI